MNRSVPHLPMPKAVGLGKSVLFIDQEIPAPEFLRSTANIVGVKVVRSRVRASLPRLVCACGGDLQRLFNRNRR